MQPFRPCLVLSLSVLFVLPLITPCVGQEVIETTAPGVKILPVVPLESPRSDTKIRLRIVSFNDFHGQYREKPQILGAAKFLTELKRLSNDYPRDYPTSLCTLCAGDNFSGSVLSYYSTLNRKTGLPHAENPLDRLFELANVTASCLGNHEFDWGPRFLEGHLSKAVVQVGGKELPAYSASNIRNKATEKPPGNVPEYDIITPDGTNIKIAVITLTTMETVFKSLPGAMDDYVFERPGVCAKRLMKTIPGVHGFIFMTHMSSRQEPDGTISFMGDAEEMLELIKLKPLAIISAHSHKFVSGKVDHVPILQAGCYGNGIASIDFIVDPVAGTFVEESQRTVDLLSNRDKIVPDPTMEQIVAQAYEKCRFDVVGTLFEPFRKDRFQTTDLGAMICKALATSFRERTKDEPVLAFQHGGGIRTDLEKGEITEEDCYNVLPFESRVDLCRLPGKVITQFLRDGLANPNGNIQIASLTLYYDSPHARKSDFKEWAFSFQGKRFWIEPEREYWVVLDHFIVSGGDGYDPTLFEGRVVQSAGPLPREVLARYFKDDLKGKIALDDLDRPVFVVMPAPMPKLPPTPTAPESLQKLPQTPSP